MLIFEGLPENGVLPNETEMIRLCPAEFRAEGHSARKAIMEFRTSRRNIHELHIRSVKENERALQLIWLGTLLERRKLSDGAQALAAYLWHAAGARLPP